MFAGFGYFVAAKIGTGFMSFAGIMFKTDDNWIPPSEVLSKKK
jgi:hypothetical protein